MNIGWPIRSSWIRWLLLPRWGIRETWRKILVLILSLRFWPWIRKRGNTRWLGKACRILIWNGRRRLRLTWGQIFPYWEINWTVHLIGIIKRPWMWLLRQKCLTRQGLRVCMLMMARCPIKVGICLLPWSLSGRRISCGVWVRAFPVIVIMLNPR